MEKTKTTKRKRITVDVWSVKPNGYSPVTGKALAMILNMHGRLVATEVLKTDAERIVEAVNAKR